MSSGDPEARRGIEIPADVAESAGVPDDLDADAPVEYFVPDTAQRRQAAYVYILAAAVGAGAALSGLGTGFWALTAGALVIAVYHLVSGTTLEVRERRALEVANQATTFAVGHASATVGFEGWLARPVWNVLLFSADDPPTERALVRVDGSNGEVIDTYIEAIDAAG